MTTTYNVYKVSLENGEAVSLNGYAMTEEAADSKQDVLFDKSPWEKWGVKVVETGSKEDIKLMTELNEL